VCVKFPTDIGKNAVCLYAILLYRSDRISLSCRQLCVYKAKSVLLFGIFGTPIVLMRFYFITVTIMSMLFVGSFARCCTRLSGRFGFIVCAGVAIGTLLWSCAAKPVMLPRTVAEYYEQGLEAFNTEDLPRAQRYFDVIKLQYPASKYADDAQYYLAEINTKKSEFILAAYNYNQLRRTFPNSEYAKTAAYKAALSSYKQSPKFDRDPDYTKQAIKAFSEFQALYPKDSLTVEAGKRIIELRTKLAEHDFRTAELYVKMQGPRAAITYYDLVITNYPDTEFLEPAFVGKARMLVRLKRIPEVQEAIRLYNQRFPQGKFREDMAAVEESLQTLLASASTPVQP
jgi:outer membrane protein assembly factor BamD